MSMTNLSSMRTGIFHLTKKATRFRSTMPSLPPAWPQPAPPPNHVKAILMMDVRMANVVNVTVLKNFMPTPTLLSTDIVGMAEAPHGLRLQRRSLEVRFLILTFTSGIQKIRYWILRLSSIISNGFAVQNWIRDLPHRLTIQSINAEAPSSPLAPNDLPFFSI